jgi:hypothetical protein
MSVRGSNDAGTLVMQSRVSTHYLAFHCAFVPPAVPSNLFHLVLLALLRKELSLAQSPSPALIGREEVRSLILFAARS